MPLTKYLILLYKNYCSVYYTIDFAKVGRRRLKTHAGLFSTGKTWNGAVLDNIKFVFSIEKSRCRRKKRVSLFSMHKAHGNIAESDNFCFFDKKKKTFSQNLCKIFFHVKCWLPGQLL